MNKIYKVIWNKAKGCYVVVSEIAKSHSKTKSSTTTKVASALLTASLLTGLGVSLPKAQAAVNVVSAYNNITTDNKQFSRNSVFLNPHAVAPGEEKYYQGAWIPPEATNADGNFTLIGYGAKSNGLQSTFVGYKVQADQQERDRGKVNVMPNSVGFGERVIASSTPYGIVDNGESGQAVGIGSAIMTTAQATAVGNNVYAIGRSSIVIGSDDNAKYLDKITKYDFDNYFKKLYANIDKDGSTYGYGINGEYREDKTIYSPTLAQGDGSIAIGARSLAYEEGATALGTLAFALKKGSTAVGTLTRAEGEGSIALGNKTSIFADNSVGTGNEIQILNQGGMAYGYKGYAGGKNSMAIGSNVYANTLMNDKGTISVQTKDGPSSFNLFVPQKDGKAGILYFDLNGAAKIAGKNEPLMSGNYFSTVMKPGTTTRMSYIEALENAIVNGQAFMPIYAEKNGVKNVIQKHGDNAIVLGSYSAALGDNSIALGHGSFALNKNTFAIGSYAFANADNGMAIGLTSRALGENSLALGVGTSTSETADDSIAIGTGSVNNGAKSALIGNSSRIWKGNNALLFGANSEVSGKGNIAIGNEVSVLANNPEQDKGQNIALGNNVKITPGAASSIVIGSDAYIGDKDDDNAATKIKNALALGNNAAVTFDGTNPHQQGDNSMAIGMNAIATLNNSIALGVNSKTDYTPDELHAKPWVMEGAIATPTSAQTGVVSVGRIREERRIVNVASGYKDTDAVNVGQLKMVTEQLTSNIDILRSGGGSSYQSIQTGKGQAEKTAAKINKRSNYELYVNLKSKYLAYEARQQLNGEEFNTEALGEIKKKLDELVAGDEQIVTTASALNDIKIPTEKVKDSNAYEALMAKIDAAYKTDSTEEKVDQISGMTEQEIEKLKIETNYNNKGAQGADSMAFGFAAKTGENASDSVAFGTNAAVYGASSVGIGKNAIVEDRAINSVAIGNDALVKEGVAQGVAIGNGAIAKSGYSVALGSSSISEDSEGNGVSFGGKYDQFTGTVQNPYEKSVLSIGAPAGSARLKDGSTADPKSPEFTRRLIHLAAGVNDTDAVNVAQLKTLANNKISLGGDKQSVTEGITLGDLASTKEDRLKFNIIGAAGSNGDNQDITTTASGNQVSIKLNKGMVTATETKAVSGQKVYAAIKGAKASVAVSDNILTVDGSKTDDIQGNTFTLGINKENLKNALNDTFAKADASNISGGTWRSALDVYSKGETDANIAKAKTQVKPSADSMVSVKETSNNPSVYELDLTSEVKTKIGNLPTDTSGELAKKLDTTTYDADKAQLTNNLDGKAGTDMGNLSEAGKNVVKGLAGEAIDIKVSNKMTVNAEIKDNKKTFTLDVNEDNFDADKIKNKIGGVTNVIPPTDNNNNAVTTAGAVKNYVEGQVTTLTEKGLTFAGNSSSAKAKLGTTVSVTGNNGVTVAATGSDGSASLTIGLDTDTKNKVDNALAKDGSNIDPNSLGKLQTNLGLDNYAKKDASNVADKAQAWRTAIDVMSTSETNTAIDNAKSVVAVTGDLSLKTEQPGNQGPTTYTIGLGKDLADKLSKLPSDTNAALDNKANKTDLTGKADVNLGNINDDGKTVVKNLAKEAVRVNKALKENAISVDQSYDKDGNVEYQVKLDASKLDADAIKAKVGGVATAIPETVNGDDKNQVTTVGAVTGALDALGKKGFSASSNKGTATVQLGKTLTVKGDGTFINGNTTADDGSATVELTLTESIKSKLTNMPDNTNDALGKKADTDLSNLTDAAKKQIKDVAGEGVKVKAKDNKVSVTSTVGKDTHDKTYLVGVNEDNFDAGKIKNLIGGVASSIPADNTADNQVTTVGAVKGALADLSQAGIKVAGNKGEVTTQLGKKVSVFGDGTYLTSNAEADNDKGSTVTVGLSDKSKKVIDNALLKDGSNLTDDVKGKLQQALGVNDLGNLYAKVDGSNVSGNADKWRTALHVYSMEATDTAIDAARTKVVAGKGAGVTVTPQGGEVPAKGPITYTVDLSQDVKDKLAGVATSTTVAGKADKDLSNLSEDGEKVVKGLAQQAVIVKKGDDTITVDETTENDAKVYKVKVNAANLNGDEIKKVIGGVTDNIPNAFDDTEEGKKAKDQLTTAGAVNNYVTNQINTVKQTGFNVTSNGSTHAVTTQLGANLAIEGDGTTISGTAVSDNNNGAKVSLALSKTYKDKIDNAVSKTDYTNAADINAAKWKEALGVSNIDLNYRANGKNPLSVTLAKGLNFVNGTNTTATVEKDGAVTFDINKTLTGINSIAADGGVTISLDGDVINFSTSKEDKLNPKKLVKLSGIKGGAADTDAVNVGQLTQTADKINKQLDILKEEVLGPSKPSKPGTPIEEPTKESDKNLNPTGNAGQLPEKLRDRVNTLLNGTAGNMVYTGPNGERLGFDPETQQFHVGSDKTQVIPLEDIVISAVAASDGTTTTPSIINNVGSALNLPGTYKPEDGGKPNNPLAITDEAAHKAINGTGKNDGLLQLAGPKLTRAVNLGDLQALAQAGYDLVANSDENANVDKGANELHMPIGTKLTVLGGENNAFTEKEFDSDNLVTYIDTTDDNKKVLRVALKKTPKVAGLELNNGEKDAKTVTITPDKDGNINLSNGKAPDDKVAISGIKEGNTADSIATKGSVDEIKQALGLDGKKGNTGETGKPGQPGTTGQPGPSGQDGLNGATITEKIDAQRNGTSGNMVYTDDQGNRLVLHDGKYYPVTPGMVQGKDGEWYQSADQLDKNGNPIKGAKKVVFATPVSNDKISISAVNPDGSVVETVKLTNVASGLGLDNTKAEAITAPNAKNAVSGQDGLLTVADKGKLNTAATIRDLQAVAQAGIDFSANSDDKGDKTTDAGKNLVHVPLGNSLRIKGDAQATYNTNDYSGSNLVTFANDGTINIAMKKAPNFNSITLGSDPEKVINLTPFTTDDSKDALVISSGKDGSGKVALKGLKDSADEDAAVTRGTFDKAMQQLGISTDGLNGTGGNNGAIGTTGGNGPAGKDGLNGTSQGQKIDALRNGTAGNMVYTTDAGERLTRVGDNFYKVNEVAGKVFADGKWYNPEDVKDGKPMPGKQDLNIQALPAETPISISAVDPNTGETVNKPVSLANIASSLGTTGTEKAADATKAVQVLLTKQGADLNKVATVGDLTVLAKAGYEVAGTIGENATLPTIHRNLGEGFTIQGAKVQQGDFKAEDYTADNLVTTVNKDNATVTIQMKRTPDFKAINLNNGEQGAKTVTITPDKNGNINLSNGPTENDKVVITGIKDGDTADSIATKGAIDSLKETLGLNGKDGVQGGAGAAGQTGPAGKDGLNGKSILEKIQAQRDGLSGNMVYTDNNGERVIPIDGKYYPAEVLNGLTKVDGQYYNNTDLQDGKPKQDAKPVVIGEKFADREVSQDKLQVSAVNPDGTTTKPVAMGNVASGLDLANTKTNPATPITADAAQKVIAGDEKDGNGGLLQAKDGLNKVATVGDLQAVSQAGLDFTSNEENATIHRPLGTTLAIKGADVTLNAQNDDKYTAANVATSIDTAKNAITIQFKKAPNFDSIALGSDPAKAVTITPDENGKSVTLAGPNKGNVEIKGVANGTSKDSIATKGQLDDLRNELGLGTNGTSGSGGTGVQGNDGPAGKDGLDGKGILDKVQGLRDGMAGTMVYTTENGDRVTRIGNDFYKSDDIAGKVKANDGKWYDPSEVEANGTPKTEAAGKGQEIQSLPSSEKLVVSAVNGRDGSTTAPTKLQNVASGLGLDKVNKPISAADAKTATDKLLNLADSTLNNVATVADLQAAAQAGMDFKANSDADGKQGANNIHRTLGQTVTVQGKVGANYSATDYATDNLVTYADATSGTINIAMKKAPTFDKVTLATGENQGIEITPTKENDGTPTGIKFGKANAGTGDSAVTITGVKEGDAADSVATKGSVDKVKEVLGLNGKDGAQGPEGIAGQNGNSGPAGKDGLNGSSIISKTQALRDGTAGINVYTDKDGNRLTKVGDNFYPVKDLVQGKDGNWYAKDDLDSNGKVKPGKTAHDFKQDTAVKPEDIKISQVNPDGSTTKPVTVGNVASGLGLNGVYSTTDDAHDVANPANITEEQAKVAIAGQDGNSGLLAKEGKELNNVATVGDLQAVAQAGLDVSATTGVTEKAGTNIHLPLGNKLTIQGNETGKYDTTNYSTANLITAADPEKKTITIAMKSTPEFNAVKVGPGNDKVVVTADPKGDSLVIGKPDTNGGIKPGEDGKVAISGIKEGATPDSVATKGSVDEIKQALGLDGANGTQGGTGAAGQTGPAGKDGLDGKSLVTKIDALRNGEAGSMVYTTPEGDRLTRVGDDMFKANDVKGKVKAKDGKWYDEAQVGKDGNPVKDAKEIEAPKAYKDKVVISTVNKDGSTTDPSVMNNVGSGLGLTGFADNKTAATKDSIKKPQAINEAGAKNAVETLLKANGPDLTKAANLQDLQAVAQAGLDVSTNKNAGQTNETDNVKHMTLGQGFGITGKADAQYDAKTYSFDNMVTTMDKGNVRIGLAKAPRFESVKLGQDDKNVITLTPDAANNTLTITNPTSKNTDGKGTVIKGVASGDTPDSVVTNQQLTEVKNFLGIGEKGADGKSPGTSPAGKDGLDGQSVVNKVDALRQGIAGNMVYTTEDGTRIVKDGDGFYPASAFEGLKKSKEGKWYNAKDVDNMGNVITKEGEQAPAPVDISGKKLDPNAKVIISAVDANGETTTPINLGNVKSGLGLTGKADNSPVPANDDVNKAPEAINAAAAKEVVAGKDGKSGLLSKSGADLTKVATVGDLQALAQAGFDFTANSDDKGNADKATMHKPLGTGISILGGNAYDKDNYTADNLATYAKDGVITITMKKSPQFDTVKIGDGANPIVISKGTDGSVNFGGGANGADPVTITGVKSDPSNPNSVATTGDITKVKEQLGINGKDGAQGAVGESGASGKDGFGNSSIGNKVNAQRNGLTGNMVYTDKDGNRLVKEGTEYFNYDKAIKDYDLAQANNGKWYKTNLINADGSVDEAHKDNFFDIGIYDKLIKDNNLVQAKNGNWYKADLVEDGNVQPGKENDYFKFYDNEQVIKQNNLRQANNGKWYKADLVKEDGSVDASNENKYFDFDKEVQKLLDAKVDGKDIMISAVNPNGNTAGKGNEITIGNVKGNLVIGENQTATTVVGGEDGKSGLLTQKENLDKAATVGDLQVLANAGMVFETNEMANEKDANKVTNKLGSTIKVTGKADATYNETEYSADNMVTYVEEVDEANKAIRIAMKQKPTFQEVKLANSDGTKAISLTPKFDNGKNEINLAGPNMETDPQKAENTKVVINGVAAGTSPDSAVNLEQLNSLRSLVGGTIELNTPVADDSLNNVSLAGQVNAQRAGISGTMVYTDKDGNRLAYIQFRDKKDSGYYTIDDLKRKGFAQGKDGNWYKATNLDGNGNLRPDVVKEQLKQKAQLSGLDPESDVIISSVNPMVPVDPQTGKSTTRPMIIANVASGLGLTGLADNNIEDKEKAKESAAKLAIAGADGKSGLLSMEGAVLNRVATIGDLQAAAQAGLDFSGNSDETGADKVIHRPLGKKLSIKGGAEKYSKETFSGENLYTTVDTDSNIINIKMAKTPVFDGIRFGNASGPALTVDKGKLSVKDFGGITFGDKGPALTVNDGKLAITDKEGKTEKIVTGDASGFWVKTDNGDKFFVPMNGTLNIKGDKNITVSATDTPAGKVPETSGSTKPATGTGTTTGADKPTAPSTGGTSTNTGNAPAGDVSKPDTGSTPADSGSTAATPDAGTTNSKPATSGDTATKPAEPKDNPNSVVVGSNSNPTFETATIGSATITEPIADNDKAVVNKGYVDGLVTNVLKGTGEAINELGAKVRQVETNANAGTASALAAASVPQILNGDRRNSFGVGMGSYHGQRAMAIGLSGTNKDRDIIYKLTGTVDSTGAYGLSAGVGFTFGKKDSERKGGDVVAPADFNRRIALLEEQQSTIQDLKQENEELKNQNKELKQEIESIKEMIQAMNKSK